MLVLRTLNWVYDGQIIILQGFFQLIPLFHGVYCGNDDNCAMFYIGEIFH